MTAKQFMDMMLARKGQHVLVGWCRVAKTLKDCAANITKQSCVHVRAGIDYANLTLVKDAITNGERGEVQPLPWGQWRNGCFPFIIDHKDTEYVRLYPAVFANLQPNKVNVTWFVDGKPTNKVTILHLLQASEKQDRDEAIPCFTIKAKDILFVQD